MQMLLKKWIKTAALTLAVMLVVTGTSSAQVTVSMDDVFGNPGETVSVAVNVSGVEAGADIQSFGFFVATDAGLTFTGHDTAGTLSEGFSVNSNTANGGVGGFAQGSAIDASGTLVKLNFTLGADGSAGNVTLGSFDFNGGVPAVAGGDPSTSFVSSSRIINISSVSVGEMADFELMINLENALEAADGVVSFNMDIDYDPASMSIDKTVGQNGVVADGVTSGATVNGNDVDADTYRIAGFANAALVGDGLFIKIAASSTGAVGTSDIRLHNVVFNAGNPVYAPRSATLTVNATNFPPAFTAELGDTTVLEDAGTISFDYDATDANGDVLTYSLSGPGTINAATGEWSLSLAGNAGVHTVAVTASDGVNTTTTTATVTIKQVDLFEANLAGFNEVPPTQTVASGVVSMRMVAADGVLEVTFTASNLSATMTGAHIHLGGVGENGGVSVNLAPTGSSFTKTYDITGNTAVVDALRNGDAYVNVHTSAYPAGEIRGQVLSAGNSAPGAATSIAPATVTVQGDPGNTSFSIAWLPVADPDGDAINYLLQIATDANFTMVSNLTNFGVSNGTAYTVDSAAQLFDTLTDATAGNVNVGGSATFYHRVITTDGSLWKAGPSSSTTLTRGTVTDTETDAALPTEFALKGNYPNPFNPTTTISFDLPETADVTVQVLDLLGREVMAVPSHTMSAGAGQTVQIDASNLSSGIYLYRVIARGASTTNMQVKTMTLLK
jgi:hypothetical protein